MLIDVYLRSLRLDEQVLWRAMCLGMIRYEPDGDKVLFYRAQRAAR